MTWIIFITSSFSSGLSAMVVILRGSSSGVWAVFCWVRTPSVSGISSPPLAPSTAQALSLWRAWVPYGGAWGLEILSRTPFFPFPFLPSQSPAAWMLKAVFC